MIQKDQPTAFEQTQRWLLNQKWLAVVVLVGIIIVGVASFTEALTTIGAFAKSLIPGRQKNLEDDPNSQVGDRPDLTVVAIEHPIWNNDLRRSEINVRVKNVGRVAAGSTKVMIYDSSTENPVTKSRYEAFADVAALKPGDERTVQLTLPYWVLNPNAELRAIVDPDHSIYETSEENNEKFFHEPG